MQLPKMIEAPSTVSMLVSGLTKAKKAYYDGIIAAYTSG